MSKYKQVLTLDISNPVPLAPVSPVGVVTFGPEAQPINNTNLSLDWPFVFDNQDKLSTFISPEVLIGRYSNTTGTFQEIQIGNGLEFDGNSLRTIASESTGTVVSVSVATANGFSGSVANAATTPNITIQTTISGIIKGVGSSLVAAVPGTDFVNPSGLTTALSNYYNLSTNTLDDLTAGSTNKHFTQTEKTKLAGIATGATANDTDANLKNRANHTGTQTASTISDFQSTVSVNTDVAANTAARHVAVTVTDSSEIDFTLTGQDITASLKTGSIDETKLDASTNASLDLADTSVQPGDNISDLTNDVGYITGATSFVGEVTGNSGATILDKTAITNKSTDTISNTADYILFSDASDSGNLKKTLAQNLMPGAISTVHTSNLTASRAVISNASGKIDVSTTTSTELGYVSGVTSAIQTQLNGKQATITGGATTITSSNLTASRALVSDGSGKVAVSSVTSTELGYVSGVTSAIQTQINTINSSLSGLTDAVVLKGTWDASAGTFPGSGAAKAGWSYIVSVTGTVNGITFNQNDRILAITNNASTTTYAANWHKLDYTDQVLSVNSQTGAVVLNADHIDDTSTSHKFVTSGDITKLSNLSGTNSGDQTITLTGDVTGSGTGSFAATVANNSISLAKMADVATGTVFYRKSASTGDPEVQTLATLKTDLGLTGTNSGDQTITLTGDVTGSGTGSFAATISTGSVTLAKMADMATASLIYRKTAGTGAPEVQTLATLKTDLGLSNTNSGDVTLTGTANYLSISGQAITRWHIELGNSNHISNSSSLPVGRIAALTASRAVVTDASGFISASSVTSTEIGYLSGVTSAIQTQLNGKLGSLNSQTGTSQTFATGTTGSDFGISSSANVHTFNIPDASTTARGLVTTGTQTIGGNKTFNDNLTVTGTATISSVSASLPVKTDASKALITAAIDLSGSEVTNTLTANKGGTGQSSYTTGDLLQATGSATLSKLAAVATGNALISGGVGTASSWGKIGLSTHVSGTLGITNGGTGQSTQQNAINALTNVAGATDEYVLTKDTTTGNAIWKVPPGLGGGITGLNGLSNATQTFATGTSGSNFGIVSSGSTHTFNIPDAAASARGLVTTGTQTFAGAKTFNGNVTVNGVNGIYITTGTTINFQAAFGAIITNSTDGSDNKQLMLSAANNFGTNRSAYVILNGNEVSTYGGQLQLVSGDVSTGHITLTTTHASSAIILKNKVAIANDNAAATSQTAFDATDYLRIGLSGTSSDSNRTTTVFNNNGRSDPSAANALANGDKLTLWNLSGEKAAIGLDTNSNPWIQGTTAVRFFTGTTQRLQLGNDITFSYGGQVLFWNGGDKFIINSDGHMMFCGSEGVIKTNDDTKFVRIAGGGDSITARSAIISVYGNDHASEPGRVIIEGGDETTGDVVIKTTNSSAKVSFQGNVEIVPQLQPQFGGVPTGVVNPYVGTTAPSGWILANGSTIGNAASGATRANADTEALFTLLWDSMANAQAAVSSGRGASAAADFAANKTLTIPDMRQKFPLGTAASGTGSTHGGTGGAIDHTHSLPAHYHGMGAGSTLSVDISHSHSSSSVTGTVGGSDGTHTHTTTVGGISANHTHTYSGTTTNTGSAHKHTIPNQSGNANVGSAGQLYVLRGGNTVQGGATGTGNLGGSDEGAHTHTFSGTTGNVSSDHVHTVTVNSTNSGHGHTFSLSAAGQTLGATGKTPTGLIGLVTGGVDGNAAMTSGTSNPPFLALNYIIKL